MSFQPLSLIGAVILLVAATSVATSQSPQVSDPPFPAGERAAPGVTAGLGEALGGQIASRAGAAGDMIGFSHSDGTGTQTITLVNTRKSWMAVYHIDRSGKIRLVSSRPIEADFSLQLNATSPLPEEIRQIGNR